MNHGISARIDRKTTVARAGPGDGLRMFSNIFRCLFFLTPILSRRPDSAARVQTDATIVGLSVGIPNGTGEEQSLTDPVVSEPQHP